MIVIFFASSQVVTMTWRMSNSPKNYLNGALIPRRPQSNNILFRGITRITLTENIDLLSAVNVIIVT